PGGAATGRRGRRWVDLDGEGSLGRTSDEAVKARERTARTKAAAAARRAQARAGTGIEATAGKGQGAGHEPATADGHPGAEPSA
ncbi:hypothetical protein, partial [Acidithiobacillus sp.]|uniref:hypothetical protein n=1 Tax=Acidithiobacillus sp. TaxID=1872118 RepID=UPI002636B506